MDLPPSVDLADLDVGDRVGDGGEGQVFLVEWQGSGPRGQGRGTVAQPWVFKRYIEDLPEQRWGHIHHLVSLAPHIELGSEMLAWPRLLVHHDGRGVGVLLPRAPAPFWHDFTLRSGGTMRRLVEAQFLFFPDPKVNSLGLQAATLARRLELLGTVAAAIEFIHGHGLVYGDLSARNILYSTGEGPDAFLLDCDGIVPQGAPYVIDSPDWQAPRSPAEGMASASQESDVYKMGLFCVRTLAKDPRIDHVLDDGLIPAELAPVLRGCLDPDPGARPVIADVCAALAPLAIRPAQDDNGKLPTWAIAGDDGSVVLRAGLLRRG